VTNTTTALPLGSALATLRVDADLSSSAAADQLEIEEDNLNDIERGAVQASTVLLASMARLYHASPLRVVKAYLTDRRDPVRRLPPRG
jgi:DNA-binding XRE family transcriptional regulator